MNGGFLGAGWAFPVLPAPGPAGSGLRLVGDDERIRQSIWLVLSTAKGERAMLPDFGCGIQDLVFQPNTAAFRGVVRAEVFDALTRWEPRMDVLDVEVTSPVDARNELYISINYRVRTNNAFYNLVYPFFINEGASVARGGLGAA